MRIKSILIRLWAVIKREIHIYNKRPLFFFSIILVPVISVIFFTSLMKAGLPTKIPAGIVDCDNTHVTRTIVRTLSSFEETQIVGHYVSFAEARKAMQRREIYGFFYIPNGTTKDALSSKQPKISFYTNEAYFVPGTLLMKDLRYASELSGLALTRETLYMKGLTEKQAMGIIQPIVVETHPLNNSFLNYSVYLNNILIPGLLILIILLSTTYSLGIEWKESTQMQWYNLAGRSPSLAIIGKLLPQTALFSLMAIFFNVYLYRYVGFPCNSGILPMILIGILTVIASQAFGVFLFGLFYGHMRITMCICSLWGILSFSLAGFTYPVTAMDPFLEKIAVLFPLRHYYLIYVNEALNGYPIQYVWTSVIALFIFVLLPLVTLNRYESAFLKFKYKP